MSVPPAGHARWREYSMLRIWRRRCWVGPVAAGIPLLDKVAESFIPEHASRHQREDVRTEAAPGLPEPDGPCELFNREVQASKLMPAFLSKVMVRSHPALDAVRAIRQSAKSALPASNARKACHATSASCTFSCRVPSILRTICATSPRWRLSCRSCTRAPVPPRTGPACMHARARRIPGSRCRIPPPGPWTSPPRGRTLARRRAGRG